MESRLKSVPPGSFPKTREAGSPGGQDFPLRLNALLGDALQHCEEGRRDLAITDLAQAVYQAAIRDGEVESLELAARIRAIIAAGGGIA